MARIYKKTDRIPVKIDDITVTLAPLTVDQKTEIQSTMLAGRNGDIKAATKGVALSVKYAVKGISGVEDGDGIPYVLEFDDQNNLTDECVSDLFNLEASGKLTLCCATLARTIPNEFTDERGNKIDGVEILKKGTSSSKND